MVGVGLGQQVGFKSAAEVFTGAELDQFIFITIFLCRISRLQVGVTYCIGTLPSRLR